MAHDEVKREQDNFLRDVVILVAVAIATGVLCFALGTVRAQSAQETELDANRLEIQKIRPVPEPSQIVTKDQLTEIVRRQDERTEQIWQDVQYLRQRKKSGESEWLNHQRSVIWRKEDNEPVGSL